MEAVKGAVQTVAGLPVVREVLGVAGYVLHQVFNMTTPAVDTLFQVVSDSDNNMATAERVLSNAHTDRFRSLLSQVTQRIRNDLGATEANTILNATITVLRNGAADVVKSLIYSVISCTLMAIGQTDIVQALNIWEQILANDVNQETLQYVLEHKYDFALFLIGLIEPTKLYATALSTDGSPDGENSHVRYNPYNEFDLGRAMNRHVVICQLQRLAKSLSHIFLMGQESSSLDELPMDTSLRSDFGNNGASILPSTLTIKAPENTNQHGEQWLFVNGMCGEYYWLQLYCEKLRDTFKRDILGVFNRSDGILWDLIECAGERDTDGMQDALLQRTLSSRAAQTALSDELSAALENKHFKGPVVMIAYSQGCLLLRLVLQDFVRNNTHLKAMKDRLKVFTFANPSIDWMGTNGGQRIRLCNYVRWTEHIANERDFIAQLGVVRTGDDGALRELGYLDDNSLRFVNRSEDWIGHLFGAQYSLSAQDYVDGGSSRLLV
jgi:hypothetical protein